MTSKNALGINQTEYRHILKKVFRHDLYVDCFHTMQKVKEGDPTLDDFTTEVETLTIGLPYPITEGHVIDNSIDPCKKILLDKEQYSNKIDRFLTSYKKDKKWLTKKYVKETKYGILPKYMFDLSVKNVKDPDIHFCGDYNWYYTGGILDKCQLFNEEYLVYTDNKNLLCIRNSSGKGQSVKVDMLDETPVFNVNINKHSIVCLRQKHRICALELTVDNDELAYHFLLSRRSMNVPFIDVKCHHNEVSSLDLNHQLTIEHIDKEEFDEFTLQSTASSTAFGQIEYLDDNNLIILDRNSIRIFDKRSKEEKVHMYKSKRFDCDELCTFIPSQDTNYMFLTSRHNILKFDIRQLNFVKRWAHMLSYAPSVMKLTNYNDGELIFVSSQKYNDRIVLLSNECETNMVQSVPNIIETWQKSNRVYNFNLYNDNVTRLKYSTVGISFLENHRGIDLCTCNSVSDIFSNTIFQDDNSLSRQPLEKLDNWMNSLPNNPKELIISHVRELSHIKDILSQSELMNTLDVYTQENKKRQDLLSNMTLENVDMAAVWFPEEKAETEDLLPSTSSQIKVTEWLKQREEASEDEMAVDE